MTDRKITKLKSRENKSYKLKELNRLQSLVKDQLKSIKFLLANGASTEEIKQIENLQIELRRRYREVIVQ